MGADPLIEIFPMPLVRLDFPELLLSLAYAGPDNFTGRAVYGRADGWLHQNALPPLQRAMTLAHQQGLRLRIFDAFRPQEAQWILWHHTPDPEFLADPRQGSAHSRGIALDLTLTDASGRDLPMGTAYDSFTRHSHHGNTEIEAAAQANRHLLLGIMTAAGWDFNRNEWWHYQLFRAETYPLLSDSALPEPMMPKNQSA